MNQIMVCGLVPLSVVEKPKTFWYLNNLQRPLLQGRVVDWRYCDRVGCGNSGASECHGCSNWLENRYLKVE